MASGCAPYLNALRQGARVRDLCSAVPTCAMQSQLCLVSADSAGPVPSCQRLPQQPCVAALLAAPEAMVRMCCACTAGESWGHAASTRVILHWRGGDRYVCRAAGKPLPLTPVPSTATSLLMLNMCPCHRASPLTQPYSLSWQCLQRQCVGSGT
jgi:hypothetical protein